MEDGLVQMSSPTDISTEDGTSNVLSTTTLQQSVRWVYTLYISTRSLNKVTIAKAMMMAKGRLSVRPSCMYIR